MKQLSITKEFTWDMAHMLTRHLGDCKNLHGHTYKMHVEVIKKNNDEDLIDGMVVDFSVLKEIVNEKVVKKYDHSYIYCDIDEDSTEYEIGSTLSVVGLKSIKLDFIPTAENLAMLYFEEINQELNKCNLELKRIKLWETPTSFVEVASDN